MSGSGNSKRHLPSSSSPGPQQQPSLYSPSKRRRAPPGFSTWNRSGVPGNYFTPEVSQIDGLYNFAYRPNDEAKKKKKNKTSSSSSDGLCRVCRRKNSLDSNQLVSCCKCRDCFHQLCHPGSHIDDLFIIIPGANWSCYACRQQQAYLPLEIGATADGFTLTERKAYLLSLSVYYLIDIILYCESKDPQLDIYPPNLRVIVQQTGNNNNSSISHMPTKMVPLDGSMGTNTGSDMLFAGPLLCQFLKDGSLEDLICGLLLTPTFGNQPVNIQTLIGWLKIHVSYLFKIFPNFNHSLIGAIKNAITMGKILQSHQFLRPSPHYMQQQREPNTHNLSLPRLSSSSEESDLSSSSTSINLPLFLDPLTISSNGISYPTRLSINLPPMSKEDNEILYLVNDDDNNQDAFSQRTINI